MVAPVARFVAEYRAGPAVEWQLHGVGIGLAPALEAAIGVGGTPYAYGVRAGYGGKVHVGRVHRHYGVDVVEKCKLGLEAIPLAGKRCGAGVFAFPFPEGLLLVVAASEEEYPQGLARVGIGLKHGHDLLHHFGRVDFALVRCKGGYAYPCLAGRFGLCDGGKEGRVGLGVTAVEAVEFLGEAEAGLEESLAVACTLRYERQHHLVVAACQCPTLGPGLEDAYRRHAL